jgi:two-component system C4-dicarboxylate transport sensor histidine kinase DctB
MAWLERANRLSILARLVSATVHDVNNALQVISGGAELLQMKAADAAVAARRGESIAAQADRAKGLLADLTQFARSAGGPAEAVELGALAERALAMRHFALGRMGATCSVEGAETAVSASRSDLLQILLNLILNAERALAGRPEPLLRIAIARADGRVAVSVGDNGPGVPPAERDVLFEGSAAGCGGPVDRLGIGLLVSRALAERAGGTLTYAPRDPSGSLFTLTLPEGEL